MAATSPQDGEWADGDMLHEIPYKVQEHSRKMIQAATDQANVFKSCSYNQQHSMSAWFTRLPRWKRTGARASGVALLIEN